MHSNSFSTSSSSKQRIVLTKSIILLHLDRFREGPTIVEHVYQSIYIISEHTL